VPFFSDYGVASGDSVKERPLEKRLDDRDGRSKNPRRCPLQGTGLTQLVTDLQGQLRKDIEYTFLSGKRILGDYSLWERSASRTGDVFPEYGVAVSASLTGALTDRRLLDDLRERPRMATA
jgi:hypothetical protein